MGEAVHNTRNIPLRGKRPDQELKYIIWTLIVVSLCTVSPSKHSRPNFYESGYTVDKSEFNILPFLLFVFILLWF